MRLRSKVSAQRPRILFLHRQWTSSLRALPDFALVGVQRGGSTSLHHYLIQHPQIAAPFQKEMHFFDRDANFARGESWYRAHFPLRARMARSDARTFDGTPDTIYRVRALDRMRALLGEIPVLIVLRDPIARAYSGWNRLRINGQETGAFAEVVDAELAWHARFPFQAMPARGGAGRAPPHTFVSRSRYPEQVAAVFERFGRDRTHVFFSEELYADPQGVADRVFAALGLPRHRLADTAAINARPYEGEIDALTRRRLEDFFAPETERLAELLGRKPPWA